MTQSLSTTPTQAYEIGELTCVRVTGSDAITIVHNVTTNDVKILEPGGGCETFVTDLRGKTLGHGFLFRMTKDQAHECLFLGAPGQGEGFVSHLDRYTIREDACPEDQSNTVVAYILAGADPWLGETKWIHQSATLDTGDGSFSLLRFPVIAEDSVVILIPKDSTDSFESHLQSMGIPLAGDAEFHSSRVRYGFPWHGIDMDARNLPQELHRDPQAISFTKGCYLGQETIARLDAMGKVQRMWMRIEFTDGVPDVGMVFQHEGKPVCRITSFTANEGGAIAYGFVRRSHFDAGSQLSGTNQAGQTIVGFVAG